MSFDDIVRAFANWPACTDAYEELKNNCLQLARSDPEHAAACHLVSGFARSYVLLYDEEAVPDALAQRAQQQMMHYLDMLASSIAEGSASARLAALNAVVLDYLQSERIF
jgi:hypothetical protein